MKKPRVFVPPGPRKPSFSPMAAPTQHIVHPVKWENTGWVRMKGTSTEQLVVTVTLSNGEAYSHTQHMSYGVGEREGIIERTLAGKGTMADLNRVYAIKAQRAMMKQNAYQALREAHGQ